MRPSLTRFIQSAILCAALLSPSMASAQDITSDLVGHWTLDETSGTTVSNVAGGGSNGTMNNGLTGANGGTSSPSGNGISFDGVDDYISVPITTAITNPSFPFTASLWAKRAVGETGGFYALSREEGAYNAFTISIAGGVTSQIGTGLSSTPCSSAARRSTSAGGTMTNGVWAHITVVYLSATSQQIYVNGALQTITGTSGTATSMGYRPNSVEMTIGGAPSNGCVGGEAYAAGSVDDVRIYDRALTAADADELFLSTRGDYTCTAPGAPTGAITYNDDLGVMQLCNGTDWATIGKPTEEDETLVGHWKLDETSGTTAVDSSNTGVNGTMSGAVSADADSVDGPRNTGIYFSGGYNEQISINNNAAHKAPSGYGSWAFWFKTDGTWNTSNSTSSIMLSKRSSNCGSDGVAVSLSTSGALRIDRRNGGCWAGDDCGAQYTNSGLLDNEWHHVVATFGKLSTDTTRLYVDGVQRATCSSIADWDFASHSLLIADGASTYEEEYKGSIDDVRIYDRQISATEVADLYNDPSKCPAPEDNLVGHWKLDETGGSTIADATGNGNNGTVQGGLNPAAANVTGKDGTALDFTPSEYIDVGQMSSMIGKTSFTMSFWMRPDVLPTAANDNDAMVMQHDDFDNQYGCRFDGSSDSLACYFEVSGTAQGRGISYSNFTTGTWYHIVYTYDGSSGSSAQSKIYLNNSLISSGTHTSVLAIPNLSNAMRIGSMSSSTLQYFNGRLDDVRVYDKALSAEEVSLLYGGTGGLCTITDKCTSPLEPERSILYNTSDNVMQYCNGEDWVAMGPAGDGGGGCSDPIGAAGDMVYNETYNVLQYCEGDEWVATGASNLVVPTEGLVGHWKLDETSGATITDSTSYGNDGNWTDGGDDDVSGETVAGKDGNALSFTSGSPLITVPHSSSLDLNDIVSVAFWIKAPTGSSHYSRAIRKMTTNVAGYDIRQSNASTRIVTRMDTSGATGQSRAEVYGHTVFDDIWHHVVVVIDNGSIDAYVDGVLGDSDIYNHGTGFSTTGDLYIGSGGTEGALDDVRIYNRALSVTEIQNLYLGTGGL